MKSSFENIGKTIFNIEFCKKYLKMFLALVLIALSYDLFVYPINLVSGGAGGLGIIFNYLFNINPAFIIFIVSFLMLLLAFFVLDFDQVISTLFVAFVYPVLVALFSNISSFISVGEAHTLIMVVFGAILTGVGQGIIFKQGLNIGGFSVLSKVVYKYTNVSVTYTNAIINAIIILIGGIFIGISMILYAIVYIVVLRIVSERIILGASTNKTFKIISDKYEIIEKHIHNDLGHDVILYDTYGAYKGNDIKLIMTVIPTSEFVNLRDYVKNIDKNAFVFVTNTYEVMGQDMAIRKVQN